MEWMILPLKRTLDFSGRSQRKEYWMFLLFVLIVSIVLSILDTVLGLGGGMTHYSYRGDGSFGAGANSHGGILSLIFSVAMIVPSIAVGVRRLHDLDKSGWWLLLNFVPLIGFIIVLVWNATEGTRGANRFGPDPKATPGDLQGAVR